MDTVPFRLEIGALVVRENLKRNRSTRPMVRMLTVKTLSSSTSILPLLSENVVYIITVVLLFADGPQISVIECC